MIESKYKKYKTKYIQIKNKFIDYLNSPNLINNKENNQEGGKKKKEKKLKREILNENMKTIAELKLPSLTANYTAAFREMATNDNKYNKIFQDEYAKYFSGDIGHKRVQNIDEKKYIYPTIVVRSVYIDTYVWFRRGLRILIRDQNPYTQETKQRLALVLINIIAFYKKAMILRKLKFPNIYRKNKVFSSIFENSQHI